MKIEKRPSLLSSLLTLATLITLTTPSLLLGQWESGQDRPLADLRADRYDYNSLENPYGAGNPYKSDGLMNPYSRYGSIYSNDSWRNPYATNPPKMSNGGELSANPYRKDSTANPYGRYGSEYSSESLRNKYGAGNPYLRRPLYVWPGKK
jgi:hypothetical protein